ncbi:hypothetical protein PIB30_041519 [Stylosanthes scabra]|uniref:Uncharacterized protein n=1 Tax=Stylosanthes scabra TaxID=79078 RepID=A0ABU6WEY1_9FABA|nr:hypothetical protein [Stylosanthes scabra]
MEDHQPMQPESEELAALLSFDMDLDFDSLFKELPTEDSNFGTSDISSLPQGSCHTSQVPSSNSSMLSEILKLLHKHLSPLAPRPYSEACNFGAQTMLRQILEQTRKHFDEPVHTMTEPAVNVNPASGEWSPHEPYPSSCKGKQPYDLQVGVSSGISANKTTIQPQDASEELYMDLVVPDSPEAQPTDENGTTHWDFGIPKVWNGLTWRNKRPQPLSDAEKGDRFRADPNVPLEWSLMGGVLMDGTVKKPPKHTRVSKLQMSTMGGSWPCHFSRGLSSSPFSPLIFREPIPLNGLDAPYPPLLIPEDFPMAFRPTASMRLNREQSKLAAYIFSVKPSDEQSEHLE